MAIASANLCSKEITAMPAPAPGRAASTTASRPPPPEVAPVTIRGVRYAQRAGTVAEHGQVGGLLVATDAHGALLWTLKVYDNVRRDGLEGDVQDVFFESMSLGGDGRLRIVNESGLVFLVDVATRVVTALPPPPKPAGNDLLRL